MEEKFIKSIPTKHKDLGPKSFWTWIFKEFVDAKTKCIDVSEIFYRKVSPSPA